jgi:hypothetical protein
LYDGFANRLDPKIALFRIPEYERDVYGLEDLERLSRAFEDSSKAPPKAPMNNA